MRKFKFKCVPETISLVICIGLLLAAWASAEQPQDNALEAPKVNKNKVDSPVILAADSQDPPERKQNYSVTSEEIDLLARAVYSEARGESFQGQVAIAAVILNRIDNPDFPDSISAVIFEPWAFTAIHDGQFWLTPDQTAYEAAREALAGNDPTGGAIYYYNPQTATNQWIRSRKIVTKIGKHVFAL